MKCHYTFDKKTGKRIFIPMCYGACDTHSLEDCHCPDPLTEHHFAKERFNEVVKQKNQSIADMQAEIKHLHLVINNLKKK
jgi:hypothetical protein